MDIVLMVLATAAAAAIYHCTPRKFELPGTFERRDEHERSDLVLAVD